jgi:predicted transcriptional regulator
MSQQAAAEKLGTTQAAVSYYLYAKRGDKRMKQLESIPSLRRAASKVAKGIASESFSMIDAMTVFCELCVSLRRKDAICDLHRDFTTLPSNCEACPT